MPKAQHEQKVTKLEPPQESPRNRFLRIAPGRMTRALKSIKLLSNLGNRSSYEFTDREVAKMGEALRDAMADFESRMRGRDDKDFSFD